MQHNNNNAPALKIDVNKTVPIKCENCGGQLFEVSWILRSIPKLLIGAAADQTFPIMVYTCKSCKHLNKQFTPQTNDGKNLI